MKYNTKAIGKRIREERIAAGFKTQGQFAEKMNYSFESRQTVARWESGKVQPCLDDLLKMCEIFNCELGYLLCEYDCKTRTSTDICEAINISEEALDNLTKIKSSNFREILHTFSKIIENEKFFELLCAIHCHIAQIKHGNINLNNESCQNIAKYLNCNDSDVKKYLDSSAKFMIQQTLMKIIDDTIHGNNIKKPMRKIFRID